MTEETIWILVPIIVLLIAGLAIVLRYKKDMAMIAKGIHPVKHKQTKKEDNLTSGLILIGIGVALYLSFYYGLDGFQAYMIAPLVLFFIGIALVLSYLAKGRIKKKTVKKKLKRKTKKKTRKKKRK